MRKNYHKKYRARKRKQGFCSRCSIRPKIKGKLTCESCLKYVRDRQQLRREKGVCTQCGSRREPHSSRISCLKCLMNCRLRRLRKEGLSESEISKTENALKNHGGICDSCGTTTPGGCGEWSLDHKDKKFRGILCCGCNSAIGHANDSPEKLDAAARYLRSR